MSIDQQDGRAHLFFVFGTEQGLRSGLPTQCGGSQEAMVLKLHRQFSKMPLLEVVYDPDTTVAHIRFHELEEGGTLRRRTRQARLSAEAASVFVEKNLDFFQVASGQPFAFLQVHDFLRSLGSPLVFGRTRRINRGDVHNDNIDIESEGDDLATSEPLSYDGGREVTIASDEETTKRTPIEVEQPENPVARRNSPLRDSSHLEFNREQLTEHAKRIMAAVPEIVFTGPFAGWGINSGRAIAVLTAGLRGSEELPRPVAVRLKGLVSQLNSLTGPRIDLRVAEGYLEFSDHTRVRVKVPMFDPIRVKTAIHPADVEGYTARLNAAQWPLFRGDIAKRVVDGLGRVGAKDNDSVQFRLAQDEIVVAVGDPEGLGSEFPVRRTGRDTASLHLAAKYVKAVFALVATDSSGAIAFLEPEFGLGVRLRDGGQVSYLIGPFDAETGRTLRLPQISLLEAVVPIARQHAVDTKSGKKVHSQTIRGEVEKQGFDISPTKFGNALRDLGAGPTTFTAPGMKSARGPELAKLEGALARLGVAPGGKWSSAPSEATVRHEYTPAIGPYVVDPGPWRHPIHWLDPSTTVFYPRFMASYPLWHDVALPVSRGEATIVGDSGGYEVVTQGIDLDPEDVIRWQLKNCSRGLILDIPPYTPGAAIQLRGTAAESWSDSMEQSVRNVQRALRHYQRGGGPFRWWGVVQGQTREQMEGWYDHIAEVYPFSGEGEGWALAPKPSTDLLFCTRYMRFARDKGIRRVHILQISGAKTVGVVLGLAALSGGFELVSYDTATAMRLAINRSAVIPDGLGLDYISEDTREGETTVSDYMTTCPCHACVWSREDHPLTNREVPHYFLLHNHLVLVEACERIYREALRDPEGLLRWAADERYGDVMREWETPT